MRAASWSCHPIVFTGFSDVIGSWKIIPIVRPRICRKRDWLAPSISSPWSSTEPRTVAWRRSTSPITVRNVTLLPDPDSDAAERRPRVELETDARHGLDDAVVRAERGAQVLDFESGCHQLGRIRGSSQP